MQEVKVGTVLVITDKRSGHDFEIGSRVVVRYIDEFNKYLPYKCTLEGKDKFSECPWVCEGDFDIAWKEPTPLVGALPKGTPRVKSVYVIQKDGETVDHTTDRTKARELKASLGGKKAGASIMMYLPYKEIR